MTKLDWLLGILGIIHIGIMLYMFLGVYNAI